MSDGLHLLFLMQDNLQRKIRSKIGQGEIADQTIEERIESIKGNVFALEHELHELIDEMKWKDWTTGPPFLNRDAAVKEAVDALHFLLNIFLHLDVTPDELMACFQTKNKVNHDRQDHDYDGINTKCTNCRRAFEDVSIMELYGDAGIRSYLCPCGVAIPPDLAKRFITD